MPESAYDPNFYYQPDELIDPPNEDALKPQEATTTNSGYGVEEP